MSLAFLTLLADATTTTPVAGPGLAGQFIPFACIAVIFYFLLIRPQQKKAKEMQALVSSVKTGDKVVTTGGIHGIVSNVKDGSTLMLKIADNVKIEVDKSAIATVNRGQSITSSAEPVAAKA